MLSYPSMIAIVTSPLRPSVLVKVPVPLNVAVVIPFDVEYVTADGSGAYTVEKLVNL